MSAIFIENTIESLIFTIQNQKQQEIDDITRSTSMASSQVEGTSNSDDSS